MASIDLMNRAAEEFRADIIDGRRKKHRLKHLKDEFNAAQSAALQQDIHLARPSHILATETATAFGWRWEDGGWTFLGLADDELSDTPYYVLRLPIILNGEPSLADGYVSCHGTFIDALDAIQWQLGRGILAIRR